MNEVDFRLRRETEAAKDLLAMLRKGDAAEDTELVEDTIEGGTDLKEALAEALAVIDECDVIVTGCKAKAAEYDKRAATAKARAERVRGLIEQALVAIDLDAPLRLPAATLSLTKRPRKVVVGEASEIPTRFWIQQPRPAPKLDEKALAAALIEIEKRREAAPDDETIQPIPGASLDNGSVSLAIRRS